MNNKTEKHSTIGSGGGMKTKWREKKSAEKERGIAVLTLAALFFWYLPQIQVSRQIRKEQEEAVEMYVREEKEENKEENEKKRRSAGAGTGQYRSKSVSDNLILQGLRSKIEKSARGSGFRLRLRCSGCARAG